MAVVWTIAAVLGIAVAVYLIVALVRPDRF
jgi:K+-transporting ATPase KdpF subunit